MIVTIVLMRIRGKPFARATIADALVVIGGTGIVVVGTILLPYRQYAVWASLGIAAILGIYLIRRMGRR